MTIGSAIAAINRASRDALPIAWTRKETADGYLYVDPPAKDIAKASGLDVEVLSLAANVQSEVGSLPAQYLYAVAEVALNEAGGQPVTNLLVGRGKMIGHYGEQSGRWAASSQKPTRRALEAAMQARSGSARGFVKGARRYSSLSVHDAGTQRGKPIISAEQLITVRYNDGWKWVGPLHDPVTGEWLIDSYKLFLMSRDGKYTKDDALAELAQSRQRWKSGGVVASIKPETGAGIVLVAGAVLAALREIF